MVCVYTQAWLQISLNPNTHRRRRRDATVELSRVGVGGVCEHNSQLAHDDVLPTDSVDNLETEYNGLTIREL